MARAEGVHNHDAQVGAIEGEIVIPAVPDDDVGFLLGFLDDLPVIHAGVDHRAQVYVRLILLALFDGAIVGVEVLEGSVALHDLPGEVPIGHRVADGDDPLAHVAQGPDDLPGRLALAGAGPGGADRDDGHGGLEHGAVGSEQPEVGPRCEDLRGLVHHVFVGHIAVGEHHPFHVVLGDKLVQVRFGVDRYALRIKLTRKDGWIGLVLYAGDLGGGESDHLIGRVVPEEDVEVVKVAPRGAHDNDPGLFHA